MKSVNPFNGEITEWPDELKEFIKFIHTKADDRKKFIEKHADLFESELEKSLQLLREDDRMKLCSDEKQFKSFCDNIHNELMPKFEEEEKKLMDSFIREFLDQTMDEHNEHNINKDRYLKLMRCWSKFIRN